MAEVRVMKAVDFAKLPAAFRKKYADEQALVNDGWLVQPKYDGCYGMAVIRRDAPSSMLSRTGEDYSKSCQHILDALRTAADKVYGMWHDFVVIGEVWHPSWDFPTLNGKFRKQAPCEELLFVMHDQLPTDLNTTYPYALRLRDARRLAVGPPLLDPTIIDWPVADVKALARQYKEMGAFDGVVVKDPNAGYTVGVVKAGEVVKVKPTLSLDLVVGAITQRPGKKTGRPVYVMTVVLPDGQLNEVGSGMPWSASALPKVGDIVEVEAMGYTPDGKLREPRFKGVRYDKEQPDS